MIERLRPTGWGSWWAWASLAIVPLIALGFQLAIGLRLEHVGICSLVLVLAWAGPRARRFSALAAPMALSGLAYDLLRLVRHWRADTIHVADLWHAEAAIFPGPGEGSLADAIALATHPVLDGITGVVYITYLPVAVGVAGWLYLRSKRQMAVLSWSFALISLLGWAIWLAWPAAPPWYVDVHGLGPARLDAAASAAGGLRFDRLVGADVFGSFYGRSWNVFGAMPSLHVGYAVVVAAAAWPLGGWLRRGTVAYAVIMSFGAVYLRHHYLLDVVAGLALAAFCNRAIVAALQVVAPRRARPAAPVREEEPHDVGPELAPR
jgi:membrane-associated phospholipid phosphatase